MPRGVHAKRRERGRERRTEDGEGRPQGASCREVRERREREERERDRGGRKATRSVTPRVLFIIAEKARARGGRGEGESVL
jgi:hypothetical protein